LSATELKPHATTPTDQGFPSWVAGLRLGSEGARDGAGALQLNPIAGADPAVETDGPLRVVFDGWLYNADELRRAGGASPQATDARLVLDAYRKLGAAVIERLKGRFALLIWDSAKQQLLAARDPLGAYPLFWSEREDELVLSLGMEELVAQPGVSGELNRVVLAEHLCCRWPDIGDTYYSAVRRLPPGHVLEVDPAGRRAYRYWDPVPLPDSDDWIRPDGLEEFDELFDQAVRRCLEPGAAGIFLSGGLDSVSVAAVATDISQSEGKPLPWALSLGFPHPDCNEEELQRKVAQQLGLPQELVWYDQAVGAQGRVRAAVEASRRAPTPLLGMWPPAYRHLAQLGREHGCKVILTGSGGDETLLASTYRAVDLMRRLQLVSLWRMYQRIQRSYPWSVPRTMKATFWGAALRPLLQRASRNALGAVSPAALHGRLRRKIADGTPPWVRRDDGIWDQLLDRSARLSARWPPNGNVYYAECRAALDHVTISMEMERVFEDGRRVGVPIHEPYWDPDLQEFLYRVPPDDLEQGGHTKGLVRGMLARRFPDAGFERQKKVIGTEFANDSFVTEIPHVLREIGGARTLAELGLVDEIQLDTAVARLASDPRERRGSYRLWHVLSLEAWLRERV
jgi:asparagine synthase (glutamine-hydrolysing)